MKQNGQNSLLST